MLAKDKLPPPYSQEMLTALDGVLDAAALAKFENEAALRVAIAEASANASPLLGPAFVSYAHAQEARSGSEVGRVLGSIDLMRPYLMLAVIVAITIFFFICIGLFCRTQDVEKLKFADNMIRTIVGFYIGIVTGLLGLPT
jgi:hypothetical protein